MNPFSPPLVYPSILLAALLFQFVVIKPQFVENAPFPVRLLLWLASLFLLYNIMNLAQYLLA